MRIPLATNLKTRTGAPSTKDARQVNSYMEIKGEQAAVRKRPAAQGGISVGTGTAQGGIGFSIGGTPYFIGFWGDTMQTYTGSGTSWSSGANYLTGDHVAVNFVDYWALNNNTNSQPPSSNWSRTYVPAVPVVITYATWNPADNAGATLSNGNLTASAIHGGVRSTIGKTSGKWYFEIHVDNAPTPDATTVQGIGVLTGTAFLGNEIGNFGTDEWGYNVYASNGINLVAYKETNGIRTAYGTVFTTGNIIGVALDMDLGQVTFYLNGVSQGIAFTGLAGTVYAGFGTQSQAAIPTWTITANFGASAFTYTPPVGFNSGLYQ